MAPRHADYHLSVLFSAEGPFGRSTDESATGEPLPYEPPPPGLFPDARGLGRAAQLVGFIDVLERGVTGPGLRRLPGGDPAVLRRPLGWVSSTTAS